MEFLHPRRKHYQLSTSSSGNDEPHKIIDDLAREEYPLFASLIPSQDIFPYNFACRELPLLASLIPLQHILANDYTSFAFTLLASLMIAQHKISVIHLFA